jgi:hypothetical protein
MRKLLTSSFTLAPHSYKPSKLLTKIYNNNVIYFADTNIRNNGNIYKYGITSDLNNSIKYLNAEIKSECRLIEIIDISTLDSKNTELMEKSIFRYFSMLRILHPIDETKDTIRIRDIDELRGISEILKAGIKHCNYGYF